MTEEYRFLDWHEWTLDSSKDFIGIWSSGGPSNPNVGKNYLTLSGNEYATKFWDWNHDPARTGLTQSYEAWHVRGSPNPTTEDEINPDLDASDWTWRTESYELRLFVDSNEDVWTLWWNGINVVQIQKLNQTTNCFEWVADRSCVLWSDSAIAISSFRVVQDGDDLHIVWMDHNQTTSGSVENWRVYYSSWDMSTGAWNYQDELVRDTSTESFVSRTCFADIAVRSTGEVVIWHPGIIRTQGTQTGPRHEYSRRTGVNTWVNATWQNSETNWRTNFGIETFRCVLGANDRIHFWYTGAGGSSGWYHRSLSNTNVLDTEQVAIASTPSERSGYEIPTLQDGADLYIYMFSTTNSNRDISYSIFKSEANPTVTTTAFVHTQGFSHSQTAGGSNQNNAFIPFTATDGTVNFFRGEYELRSILGSSGWHQLQDGIGGFIYAQKVRTGTFGTVRQMFGNYQQPRGELDDRAVNNWTYPTVMWEWLWPIVAISEGTFRIDGGGRFALNASEYFFWWASTRGAGDGRLTKLGGVVLYVQPIKELPSVKTTHTADMILKPKPIDHTTDMRVVALAGTQNIDHTTDMRVVARPIPDHTTDMSIVNVRTIEHTTDMYLIQEVIFTVAVTIEYTVNVSYIIEPPADIEVVGLRDITTYSTGGVAGSGGSSYSRRKKRRIDRT